MKTLFISDLHLDPKRHDIQNCFKQFIHTCLQDSAAIEAVYILGDLFEVWLGDDISIPIYSIEINLLQQLSINNIKLFIMHGNRDFLLGSDFSAATGCTLIPDPYPIILHNKKIILSHGDDFCTDDIEYLQFKKMIRNPQWQKEFLAKPGAERINIAQSMRQASQEKGKVYSALFDVDQNSIEALMLEHNAQTLIHGHTHQPDTHKFTLNNQPARRIVLPDWKPDAEVLCY